MSENTPRRCLLIAPLTFYSFHQILAAALERRGYSVDLINEEFPANPLGKMMGKLALPLLRLTTLRGLKKQLENRPPYSLVLIVKGRGLGKAALRYLRSRARRIVGYNFDSFDFNPSARDWHMLTDRFATFDIADSARTGLPLVHLFSAVPAEDEAPARSYDISIVQRVHSSRLARTERLLAALPPGWKPFVFLYESSWLLFLLGFVRQPRLYRRMWRYISFRPLPYSEAMKVLGASRVTIDFAHPKQSGITIRCFEAQSMGVAVLTDNRAAVENGVFDLATIAHFTSETSLEDVRLLLEKLHQSEPASRTRSVDAFLSDLLDDTENRPEDK